MKKLITITCLLLLPCYNFAFADGSGNSDDTLQVFNPNNVLADQDHPTYVTSYIDKTNHHVKSTSDFSIGINVGANIESYKFTQENGTIKKTDHFDSTDAFGSLTLAYGKKVLDDNMYLGLAVDGAISGGKYENTVTAGGVTNKLTVEMPYSFGAYLVPGFMLTPKTMLFAKIGAAGSNLEVDTSTPNYFQQETFSEFLPGFRAGAGIQAFVLDQLSFDVDYMFTIYTDAHHDFGGIKNTYAPLTNQISVGLTWHFNQA
jgi:opacity protein-like surface antigen